MSNLLTEQEHRLIEVTADVYKGFKEISGFARTRSADLNEVAQHIHALQSIILAQAAARAYSTKYRLLGEDFD